jgi:hypothetical protein
MATKSTEMMILVSAKIFSTVLSDVHIHEIPFSVYGAQKSSTEHQ